MGDRDQAVHDVQHQVERARDDLVTLTRDLVRTPSVNPKFLLDPELNREAAVQDILEPRLRADGFRTERWDALPGRPNLVADRPGGEERSLILCGHVDVVPPGERDRWRFDPFAADIHDGRLYGRGSLDMKGGLAACVAAAAAIRAAGITLDGRLSIHAVVDEEAGGFGAMDAVARGKLAGAVLVAEPTGGQVLPAEGGLEWVRVTIRGRAAHSGWRYNEIFPQADAPGRLLPGVNAIELATRFLDALRHYERDQTRARSHPLLPPGLNTINPGVIRGGAGLGPDGLPVIMTNPAIIPDTVVIDLDYKFLPDQTSAEIRAGFEAFVHHFCQADSWLREHPIGLQWQLGGLYFPPMDTPVDHPLVRSLVGRRAALAGSAEVRGFIAVCDAAHYAGAGCAGVIFGPAGDGLHGEDEYVEVESLVETAKVIAAAIIDWCGIA